MGLFGDQLGSHFRLQKPRALITRGLGRAPIAVTELRCELENHGMTMPIVPEDAFVVALQLRDYSGELWLDGKPTAVSPIPEGRVSVYDLNINTQAYLRTPFHCLQFYLPGKALETLATQHGGSFDRNLNCRLGAMIDDPIWAQAAQMILPALDSPEQPSRLFLDHFSLALAAHFATRYGNLRADERRLQGGLAPWQLRLAKEFIFSKLDGEITVAEMAIACGVTPSHFAHAFKRSTGFPPHRWLMMKRLEKSKTLLADRGVSMLSIAAACGFVDQSHFSRAFTRAYSITPSVWRRSYDSDKLHGQTPVTGLLAPERPATDLPD